MSLAKSEGSSRHKGKEIAVNDPPMKAKKGEEAPYFELDHFKEERNHDPSNVCPPLIDPWYDTHLHFPVVPSDYLPPPSRHVWISLEWRDSNISLAPLVSSILNLAIRQGDVLPVPILFEFGSGTSLNWKERIDK